VQVYLEAQGDSRTKGPRTRQFYAGNKPEHGSALRVDQFRVAPGPEVRGATTCIEFSTQYKRRRRAGYKLGEGMAAPRGGMRGDMQSEGLDYRGIPSRRKKALEGRSAQ